MLTTKIYLCINFERSKNSEPWSSYPTWAHPQPPLHNYPPRIAAQTGPMRLRLAWRIESSLLPVTFNLFYRRKSSKSTVQTGVRGIHRRSKLYPTTRGCYIVGQELWQVVQAFRPILVLHVRQRNQWMQSLHQLLLASHTGMVTSFFVVTIMFFDRTLFIDMPKFIWSNSFARCNPKALSYF